MPWEVPSPVSRFSPSGRGDGDATSRQFNTQKWPFIASRLSGHHFSRKYQSTVTKYQKTPSYDVIMFEFNEDHGVLLMKITSEGESGQFDEARDHGIITTVEELYEGQSHRYLIVDIPQTPGGSLSREYRKWMSREASRLGLEKITIVRASSVTRIVSKVVMATMGKTDDVQSSDVASR